MTSTNHNPDERDLLDFADAVAAGQNPQPRTDEERTYLHVHNAMQGESAAIPSTTKQSTWEDVMSTLALTPEAPVSNRTRKQQGLSSPPPRAPRARRMQWTPLASVAAAVLVIVASFGVWQQLRTPPPTDPPLAPELAALVPIPASPEATQIHSWAVCSDLTEETRVLVVESPTTPAGTTNDYVEVWLESNGDVIARCPDGTDTLLAEGMSHLNTTNSAQIVVYGQQEDRLALQTYHHIGIGKTIDDAWGLKPTFATNGTGTGSIQMVISSGDPSQWSIANFDEMEESTIEELSGQRIYSGQSITAVGSADHQTVAIAISMYETEGSAILLKASGAPGDVVVISSDMNEVHWVSVPDGFGPVNNISLSDDGSQLTLITSPSQYNGISDEISVTLDVETGEVVDED